MYRDNNGLITQDEAGTSAENSFLWTMSLLIVLLNKGEDVGNLKLTLGIALDDMYLGKGLYKQAPHLGLNSGHDSYMSHDQLTAIICYLSFIGDKARIKEILKAFKYGVSYNNVDNKFRPYHPRDLIFYNIMAGSRLAYLFLPLLWLITLYTFIKDTKTRNGRAIKKTDGEILHYTRRSCTNVFKPIDGMCNMLVRRRFGSWDKLFSTYYKDAKHPINKITNK